MSANVNLKASGLQTFANALSLEEGALLQADNIVIDKPGIIEQRRGFAEYGEALPAATAFTKQLLTYKGEILRHFDDKLQYDNGSGDFTTFSGSYTEPVSDLRIKGIEANSNFYFTTSDGVQKISASAVSQFTSAAGFITRSGMPPALDLTTSISLTAEGYLPPESKAAYRIVWGQRDANNNLILGAPSQRQEIAYSTVDTLIPNINTGLHEIDSVTAGLITENDYFSTLNLSDTDIPSTVRSTLISLAAKLDNDLKITEIFSIVQVQIPSSTVAYVQYSGPVTAYLTIGDKVEFANMSTVTQLNNTASSPYWTVTDVVGATATLAVSGLSTAGVTSATGNTYSYEFRSITEPAELSISPTYTELTALLTYYEAIVEKFNGLVATWANLTQMSLPTQLAEVRIEFTIPEDITTANYTNFFYQIYRTEVTQGSGSLTLSDVNPGDEMALILEDNPTLAEVNAGVVVVFDSTDDNFRGVNLYTNANSGEGILQANYRPPVARDLALFKDCLFFAGTRSNHKKSISQIGYLGLNTAVTAISVISASVSSNIATIGFNGAVSSYLNASSNVTLTGFAGSSVVLNGNYNISSVGASSFNFPVTTSDFTATSNLGDVSVSEYLTITRGLDVETFIFIPSLAEKTEIIFNAASTLANTGTADYFLLYSANNETNYHVWYNVGSATAPSVTDSTPIEVTAATSDTASTVATNTINAIKLFNDFNSDGTDYLSATGYVQNINTGFTNPIVDVNTGFTITRNLKGSGELASSGYVGFTAGGTPAQNIADISQSLVRVINRFTNGDFYAFYLSGVNDPPGKIQIESRDFNTTPFSITVSSTAVSDDFDPTIPVSGTSFISDNEVNDNYIYFSKPRQPESVPLVNFFPIGPKDKKILRILALRDSLFILKEDGIYRISGDNPNNFASFLFDTSAKLLAPDSAVVLNNQIYMWSDQGVVTVSDTGVSIVSRAIENRLNGLVNFPNYSTAGFGVAYDLDRAYLLWVVSKTGDTKATQCYRYNIFTQSWTRWDLTKTCGIVSSRDNKLYLGDGLRPYVNKERKSLSRIDFCDRDFEVVIADNAINDIRILISSISDVKTHDVIAQDQYITLSNFNLLLKKLDLDPATSLTDNYYDSLAVSAGANLRDSMLALASKLDTDMAVTTFSSLPAVTSADNAAPSTLQTAYNSITQTLNSIVPPVFSNYPSVTGTVLYESLLENVSISEVAVSTHIAMPFVVGPATIYKHYISQVEYAPQHFGNPIGMKHVREATYLFFSDNFQGAEFGFASDLSPSFEFLQIDNVENGTFGNYIFGDGYFGGTGQSIPLRVLIPQQKQRCTFIRSKFKHSNARELYQLFGASLVAETNAVEGRAYK